MIVFPGAKLLLGLEIMLMNGISEIELYLLFMLQRSDWWDGMNGMRRRCSKEHSSSLWPQRMRTAWVARTSCT